MNFATPPRHVAIIMDGNGRWAETRGRPRLFGHIKGTRVAKKTVEWAREHGIKHLTLYAFSNENWYRPEPEIKFLFALLLRHLPRELKNLLDNNIRFNVIGQIDRLPASVVSEIRKLSEASAHCTGMVLNIALSYGGRQDIVSAAKSLAKMVADGELDCDNIDEAKFATALATHDIPDPDLIIRTSGEWRLSNFFLWQAAYSELYISDVFWPSFSKENFEAALESFYRRERRYGMTSSQIPSENTRLEQR